MKIVCLIIFFFILNESWAAKRKEKRAVFKGKTEIDNPFSLRDPFKSQLKVIKTKKELTSGIVRNGIYTNVQELPELRVDDIIVKGVIVGKKRRAFVSKGKGKTIHVLREGKKFENERLELKAILPGGLIFVEKMSNVYGEEEYLETVVPISK